MPETKSLYTIQKNDLYGLIDGSGKIVTEPVYTFAFETAHGYGLLEKDGLQGLIDPEGNFVLGLAYKAITVLDKLLFGIKKDEKFALLSLEKEQCSAFDYHSIFPFAEGLAAAYKETGMGYLNENGEEEIPFIFSYAESFHQGCAVVKIKNKYGLINREGSFVQEARYDWCKAYPDCYHVNIGGKISDDECYLGKSGLLSKDGREITALIFDDLDGFTEGRSAVRQGNLFGTINESGIITTPVIFDQRVYFSEGLAAIKKDGKYGYVNSNNQFEIACKFKWAGAFHQGAAIVSIEDEQGFIDRNGNFLREPEPIKLLRFREGCWEFNKEGKLGLMNEKGEIIIPPAYESITAFYPCGLAWAKKDGRFGIINKKNEFVFPPSFDLTILYPINEDYIHIELNGKSGLLSTLDFKWILPPEYDSIGVFKGSLAELKKDGKMAYANREGRVVWTE